MKKVGKVLADGESTGHKHVLQNTEVLEREDGVKEFIVEDKDTLTHEEHNPITLNPGKYESGRIEEYDHFAEEARKVQD